MVAPRLWVPGTGENNKFATFINLLGGNDALNTLIPTRLDAYRRQRPDLRIEPTQGASLDAGPYATADYVLHPAMPTVARLYREGRVAFVRMIGYPQPNQSHFESQAIWSRGYRTNGIGPDSGWIARYKDLYAQRAIDVVALGLNYVLDFQGGLTPSTFTLAPAASGPRPPYVFAGDIRYPANDALRHQLAEAIVTAAPEQGMAGRARAAQLAMYAQQRNVPAPPPPPPLRPTYPLTDLGFVLDQSAQMIRRELGVKIFYGMGGGARDFDTHVHQGTVVGVHADSLRDIDDALNAYCTELQQMGAWERAAIVILSEFGRRNRENGSGTDHGAGGVMIVLGGGVRGGMYGPELREEHVSADVLPTLVDFRTVYEELLSRHFEVEPAPVFTEVYARVPALGLFG
jgi:uncharacterized protein (DUF1501 family)